MNVFRYRSDTKILIWKRGLNRLIFRVCGLVSSYVLNLRRVRLSVMRVFGTLGLYEYGLLVPETLGGWFLH